MTLAAALVVAGQAFYGLRFVVQWLQSERAGRSVTPTSFWVLSLCGVALGGTGTVMQAEWVLVPAFLVNAALYTRNLFIDGEDRLGPLPAALIGLALAALLIAFNVRELEPVTGLAAVFLAVGIVGQVIFTSRFIVQWYLSERVGRSHFPPAFWWLSLVGALFNLAYTVWLGKPEFVLGYAFAWFFPLRNLMLIHKQSAPSPLHEDGAAPPTSPTQP